MTAALRARGGDPWAVIAEMNDHRHLRRPDDDTYPVIFQLDGGADRAAVGRNFDAVRARRGWTIPAVYADDRAAFARSLAFGTATLTRPAYEELRAGQVPEVRAWSLQRPALPGRARPPERIQLPRSEVAPRDAGDRNGDRLSSEAGEALFGVIDSGCPFAREDLLRDDRTRIVALWDQDSRPVLGALPAIDPCRAATPAALGYGGEVSGVQLDRWIDRFRDSGGAIDEAACYRAAGYRLLAGEFQHGAAVLGLLAGASPLADRHPANADAPPRWRTGTGEPAARAGIVFVQVSTDSHEDSSSASLPHGVLDGLRYIVAVARARRCRRLVVNLSGGTSRSAHDGRSIIEQAMLALVSDTAAQQPPLDLRLVLAAGNAFAERRHATLEVRGAGDVPAEVTMRLPPAAEAASFVTVALPPGASDIEFALVPPGGDAKTPRWFDLGAGDAGVAACWPDAANPAEAVAWLASLPPPEREARIVALSFAPTASFDARFPLAPVGDWVILARRRAGSARRGTVPVRLWISRGQPNPGALDRARQARFVDTDGCYDPGRALRAAADDARPPRSPIRRRGSLNGLVTLVDPKRRITVVGSRTVRERRRSAYSSHGPVPSGRAGPDGWRPTDFSSTLAGVRTAGVTSGSTVRVEGTSFAAPQWARELLNDAKNGATNGADHASKNGADKTARNGARNHGAKRGIAAAALPEPSET